MIHLRLEAKVWEEKLNPHVYNQRAATAGASYRNTITHSHFVLCFSTRVCSSRTRSEVRRKTEQRWERRSEMSRSSASSVTSHQKKTTGFNSEYYWFKLFKTSVIKNIYKYELSTPLQNQRYVHTGHFLLLQFSDCFGWIFFSFLVTTLFLSSVKV